MERSIAALRNRLKRGSHATQSTWAHLYFEWNLYRAPHGGLVPFALPEGRGVYVRAHTSDWSTLQDVLIEGWHRPARKLPKAPVILDLGSNAGYSMVDYSILYPQALIIGIELDQENFDLAQLNLLGVNSKMLHCAVALHDGVQYYDPRTSKDAFAIGEDFKAQPNLVAVPGMTVLSVMEYFGLETVDFLKMDIEGAEIEILLKGDLAWLNRVSQFNIEIHSWLTHSRVDADLLVDNCIGRIREFGFEAIRHDSHWSSIVGFKA